MLNLFDLLMWLHELYHFRLSGIKPTRPFIERKLTSFTFGWVYYGLNKPMIMHFATKSLLDIRVDITQAFIHRGSILGECKGGIHAYSCQN